MTPLRCYLPYHHWAIQGHWAPTAGYKEESLMRFSLRLVLASRSDDNDKDNDDDDDENMFCKIRVKPPCVTLYPDTRSLL